MVSALETRSSQPSVDTLWKLLEGIPDPEIPVISIVELGIVRDIAYDGDTLVVSITPTYSGCPATAVIAGDIARTLDDAGVARREIRVQLAPAWSTDWIVPAARDRLRLYGIAPPGERGALQPVSVSGLRRRAPAAVPCPRCGSLHTRELSPFGSTPCKAQYRCEDCLEPFDYFKPL